MEKKRNSLIAILAALLFTACSGTVDPANFITSESDRESVDLPSKCQYLYQSDNNIVAVTEFVNRTTFTDAKTVSGVRQSQRSYSKTSSKAYSSIDMIYRDMSPQLGEFAQGAVESKIVSIGGVTVAARAQMDQILKEQEFQMTIADPDTAVDFGRLLGARYIITGSVDNMNAAYTAPSSDPSAGYKADSTVGMVAGLAAMIATTAINTKSGWNVEVEMTVNIIDVSTGAIINTKRVRSKANAGDSPGFNFDQIVAGAKKAMGDSIATITPMLVAQFSVKGYVNELRGNKKVAMINLGTDSGVNAGDKMQPYEVTLRKDFMSGREECAVTPLSFTMTVLPGAETDHAWTSVNTTDAEKLKKLKIGTLVRRVEVGRR